MSEAEDEAEKNIKEAREMITERYQGDLDQLKDNIRDITGEYQLELEYLSKTMDEELLPFQEKLNLLRQTISKLKKTGVQGFFNS